MRHIKAPVGVARKVTAERLLWQIIDADGKLIAVDIINRDTAVELYRVLNAFGAMIEALAVLVQFINKLDERGVFQFTPDLLNERDDVRAAGRNALGRAGAEGKGADE